APVPRSVLHLENAVLRIRRSMGMPRRSRRLPTGGRARKLIFSAVNCVHPEPLRTSYTPMYPPLSSSNGLPTFFVWSNCVAEVRNDSNHAGYTKSETSTPSILYPFWSASQASHT